MTDKDKTELTDNDLDAVQGGGRLPGLDKGLGDTRAGSSGFSVPGSNLMEPEEEEIQMRPSPELSGGLAKIDPMNPKGPGIK